MRYKINSAVAYSRKMKTKIFLRWFFYCLILMLLYSLMSCGAFGLWQPFLIISFAVGVSMREQEFASAMFGILCGFMLDIALDTLFGFFAVLLMPCCFLTSLFSRNLIKVNFLNHIMFTAVATLFSFSMHFLFNYAIWNLPGREIIALKVLLPSLGATVLTAPLMYLLSKLLARKLGLENEINLSESLGTAQDTAEEKTEEK